MARCLVCGKPAPSRAVNPAFPFCSERCRLVDLGKWLGEEYRIPAKTSEEDDGEPPGGAGPPDEDDGQDGGRGGQHDA